MSIQEKKLYLVVPTIREDSIRRFIREWAFFLKNIDCVIIVEDHREKEFDIGSDHSNVKLLHYSWADIEHDLGHDSWIIPRKTSAIRSYGFWKAHQLGADTVISLDDDCYPLSNYITIDSNGSSVDCFQQHFVNLYEIGRKERRWISSIRNIRPRGLPYIDDFDVVHPDRIILSHGLWAHIPDLDGKTQLEGKEIPHYSEYLVDQLIPKGMYFPICSMNTAWKKELTIARYHLLMGEDRHGNPYGVDRFDDIWAGLFAKKICDHLGYRIVSGYPVVWHDRASNPVINSKKEESGLPINESLWKIVDSIILSGNTIGQCYREIAEQLTMDTAYWEKVRRAMMLWSDLF
ncbi:MAG: hypothetical protein HY606_11460 [Planctomycetes bacterium]|nr:hypothetical protein [Planctomycetota bacterium]